MVIKAIVLTTCQSRKAGVFKGGLSYKEIGTKYCDFSVMHLCSALSMYVKTYVDVPSNINTLQKKPQPILFLACTFVLSIQGPLSFRWVLNVFADREG